MVRFRATGLSFPAAGCWEVTAAAAERELSFVVWVEPLRVPLTRFPGSVEEADAFFGAWLPDAAIRHWVVTRLVASPQPIKTFSQAVRLSNPAADSLPCTFIRCPIDGEVWASIYDPIGSATSNPSYLCQRHHPGWSTLSPRASSWLFSFSYLRNTICLPVAGIIHYHV